MCLYILMLLKNCSYIITQNKRREILENSDILIKKDKIISIRKKIRAGKEKIIDCKGKIVMPGLINMHTHLPMTLFRGYADDLSLEKWLRKKIWPIEVKYSGKEVYFGALLGCLENIKFGGQQEKTLMTLKGELWTNSIK